jgi:hypothetical protein
MKKRVAQLNLSFGMIFSIILIVIFLVFAFWAITKFLGLGETAQVASFKTNLQNDVDRLWKGSQGSWSPESGYSLPKKIEYVCFLDFSKSAVGKNKELYPELGQANSGGEENLIFYPIGSAELISLKIEEINLEKITENDNPYCIKNQNGKVMMTIEKNYGENLVLIH